MAVLMVKMMINNWNTVKIEGKKRGLFSSKRTSWNPWSFVFWTNPSQKYSAKNSTLPKSRFYSSTNSFSTGWNNSCIRMLLLHWEKAQELERNTRYTRGSTTFRAEASSVFTEVNHWLNPPNLPAHNAGKKHWIMAIFTRDFLWSASCWFRFSIISNQFLNQVGPVIYSIIPSTTFWWLSQQPSRCCLAGGACARFRKSSGMGKCLNFQSDVLSNEGLGWLVGWYFKWVNASISTINFWLVISWSYDLIVSKKRTNTWLLPEIIEQKNAHVSCQAASNFRLFPCKLTSSTLMPSDSPTMATGTAEWEDSLRIATLEQSCCVMLCLVFCFFILTLFCRYLFWSKTQRRTWTSNLSSDALLYSLRNSWDPLARSLRHCCSLLFLTTYVLEATSSLDPRTVNRTHAICIFSMGNGI